MMFAEMAGVKFFIALVVISGAIGRKWVDAQVHHVVGGDNGWNPSLHVPSWTSGKIFRVGDKIWFTYSAAQESIVELGSVEEYLSCDLSNPIKMYTEGLDRVALEKEGIRYFASGKPESCQKGLKIHVDVQPQPEPGKQEIKNVAVAAGPTIPSASTRLSTAAVSSYVVVFLVLLLC